jgi:hypothetical protein
MGECRSDAGLDVARVLEPDPAHADSFRHGREIRILEFRAGGEEACRFLLDLDEAKGAVVEHDDFYRQTQLHQAEEIAHQHGKPAVTR